MLFDKDYFDKSIAISKTINIVLSIARLIIKPIAKTTIKSITLKQMRSQLANSSNK